MKPSADRFRVSLPPPARRRGRSAFINLVWVFITVTALIAGVVGGIGLGKKQARKSSTPPSEAVSVVPTAPPSSSQAIEKHLAEARIAISEGQWSNAGQIYQQILEIHPGNGEALASLPLIEKRLQEVRQETVPVASPPQEIKKGIAPLQEESRGKLELVSEPRGAEFRVLKKTSDEPELVQAGKTPARVEALDVGEYEVQMAVEGWPEYSQKVRIEANRSTSVSAVFSRGGINVISNPSGAEVWVRRGEERDFKKSGITPLIVNNLPLGRHQVEVRYENWTPIRRTVEVKGDVTQNLEFAWKRSLVSFTSDPEGAAVYLDKRRLGTSVTTTPFMLEMPEGDYLFEARVTGLSQVSKAVYLDGSSGEVDFSFQYGSISIESQPLGAAVISNGSPLGRTPLKRTVMAPGTYSFEVRLENHKVATLSGAVEAGGQLAFNTRLVPDSTPPVNRNFTNGLGQQMIWFDKLGGWVAATETIQLAYERIVRNNPSAFKDPNRPVDSVNWYDATGFCQRLTIFESSLGNVPSGFEYRLPTDEEWSHFAGKTDLALEITGASGSRYHESQPVASVPPNNYGLFDIRGNVAEWVQDWYSQQIVNRTRDEGGAVREEWVGAERKVLRGGSWLRSGSVDLDIAYRRGARPLQKDANDVGFRVVLMPKR